MYCFYISLVGLFRIPGLIVQGCSHVRLPGFVPFRCAPLDDKRGWRLLSPINEARERVNERETSRE